MTEPENSLTLDVEARTRAAEALRKELDDGYRRHYCAEWDEGDGCTICWEVAAIMLRAAEGLQECGRCRGQGVVDGGNGTVACCPECGGDGLEKIGPVEQAPTSLSADSETTALGEERRDA
jgi:hypothetical protein